MKREVGMVEENGIDCESGADPSAGRIARIAAGGLLAIPPLSRPPFTMPLPLPGAAQALAEPPARRIVKKLQAKNSTARPKPISSVSGLAATIIAAATPAKMRCGQLRWAPR